MSIRQVLQEKKGLGLALGGSLVAVAMVVLVVTQKPPAQANLNMAFFSVDDGKTWFAADAYKVAPFTHEGKEAVQATVYSYAGGSRKFCGFLTKFTPEGKKRLEEEYARAKSEGKPPGSVALLRDRTFMQSSTLVKAPGGKEWLSINDPKAESILSVRSPDGSEHDQVFVY